MNLFNIIHFHSLIINLWSIKKWIWSFCSTLPVIHSRESNQFINLSFQQYHNSDPQIRHSTLAHFIHFNPHSLSFISHYSTIISSFLFNITEYNHGNIIFIIHYSYHSFLISIYIYTLIPYQFYSYLTIHVNHFQSHKLVSYIK